MYSITECSGRVRDCRTASKGQSSATDASPFKKSKPVPLLSIQSPFRTNTIHCMAAAVSVPQHRPPSHTHTCVGPRNAACGPRVEFFSGVVVVVVVVSSDDPGMLPTNVDVVDGLMTLSAANAKTDYQVLYKVPAATAAAATAATAACFLAVLCGMKSTVLEYRLRIGLYNYGLPNYEPLI
jgi:hypothetical protein